MIEISHEIPQQVSFCDKLIKQVETKGKIKTHFSMKDLHTIFNEQTKADNSGDLPVLLPGFEAQIRQNYLFLYAPYTIDEDKKSVVYQGIAKNDENGNLVEVDPISVEPSSLRKRTLEAFEGQLNLPNFIKLITEDALKGEAIVEKMFIDGEKLAMVLKKPIK